MKTNSKRLDLLIALGLNVLFFIAFVFVIGIKHETNDDLALSLLVEGAYGERTPYMIYSNVLWGKILVGLYEWIPTIKWYMVLMLTMLFGAHTAMSYVNLRTQGRKLGLVVSTTMLLFLGFYTYGIFQYSRIAPVVTAAGLLLLFYAIEHAESKRECVICLILGVLMAIWGSLVRFQMFALAVALVGGAIGLHRVWMILKERRKDWLKRIAVYVVVFGTVGVLSLLCLVIDKMHYMSEEWQYYQKFNVVRTELWDYGFPDYEGNEEAYKQAEADYIDCVYYQTWNMDEEAMTLENLQMIADAKPEKHFDLFGFLSIFPKYYFSITAFVLFLVLAVIAFGLNWKNLYFILFECAGVMAFEAYFYYIGRYAIPRIDNAMWMVAVMTLVYAMAGDIKAIKKSFKINWKQVVFSIGIVGIIFVTDYARAIIALDGVVNEAKSFYEVVKEDDEHLYIMMAKAPKIYYAFDLWEPSELGELSNIYNSYGWEFNHEVKKAVLDEYNIENIYRDAINNENVYFVTGPETALVELYIQNNYDPNARLVATEDIYGVIAFRLISW